MKRLGCSVLLLLLLLLLLVPGAAAAQAADTDPAPVCSPWAREEVARAEGLHLLFPGIDRDYRAPITRIDFSRMALAYAAARCGMDYEAFLAMVLETCIPYESDGSIRLLFSDCQGEDALVATIAHRLGLVKGVRGQFDPQGLLTRQEAAALLLDTYEGVGGEQLRARNTALLFVNAWFKDSSEVQFRYKKDVAAVTCCQWMRGVAKGIFAPEETFSTEQCIVAFLRLWSYDPDGWTVFDPYRA